MTNVLNHPLAKYRTSFSPAKSRAELADQLGVDRSTIQRWEQRTRFPDKRYLDRLARLTGASVEELMGLRDAKGQKQ